MIGLLLEALTIYLPPLRPIFHTVTLDPEALMWIAGMSVTPLVMGELYKLTLTRPST